MDRTFPPTLPERSAGFRVGRGAEHGFTIIELNLALIMLAIAILALMMGFSASRRLSLISERHATMAHLAEQEIERLEGIEYGQIALASAPSHSSDPSSPDYYVVNGSPTPSYQFNRTISGNSEQLAVDTNGQVSPAHTQQNGTGTYTVYDFVTWTQDPRCAPGCPGNTPSYKRLTVAVTVAGGLEPSPVYTASMIADPAAEAQQGVANGTPGNPILSPATHCVNAAGQIVECANGLAGTSNIWYLHDWPATAGAPQPPSSDHATHPTVGATDSSACPQTMPSSGGLGSTAGCPVPDEMDQSPPTAQTAPAVYRYSTDVATTGYQGGAMIFPSCTSCGPAASGAWGTGTGGGTGSSSDCSDGAWRNNLINFQSHFWLTAPLAASTTLTGDGALTVFSQTGAGASAVVTLCVELYDVPPTAGVAGSLADILLAGSRPVALGGAAFAPATDPATGANWPTTASQESFVFRFVPAGTTTVTVAAGHRVGLRLWAETNLWTPIDLIYDNPDSPAALQLNSQ